MDKGKIIVLEGLDGCGKGAQLRELRKMVGMTDSERRDAMYQGRRVVFTREPGGTEFAEKMRTLIVSGMKTLSGKTQLFNFFAARNDHWERVVIPAVERGDLVISDRADASTFAFQIYGQDAGQDVQGFFLEAREFVYGAYEPDAYLFINVSPEECQRRLKQAAFEEGREISDFDTRHLEFHRAVQKGYVLFGGIGNVITINGEQPIERVHDEIRTALDRIL